jgi:pSer/pThr/pTyr-binding forkhead associated (FHA) protein
MTDPRLNSIHLDLPRRQQFRAAREALLHARGNNTLCAERQGEGASNVNLTAIEKIGPAPAPTAARFVLMDRDYVYPLQTGLNTIGRLPDNDIVLDDAYVSRRHCAVLVHAGGYCELHDVASKNGTILNGHRIEGPTRLKSGDEIKMCTRNLVFVCRTPEEAASPATQNTRSA